MEKYIVSRMTREEVDTGFGWAAAEGWNPGLNDAACFWEIDPDGFLAGRLNGQIVACGSALCYDDDFAFCGMYIVAPEFRGRGLGLELTHTRLEHIGHRNAGLDGVLDMVDRYARLGYRRAHTTTRYTFTPQQHFDELDWLLPVSDVDFKALADYDTKHFPARREPFLQAWLTQPGSRALAAVDGEEIKGYGVIRQCRDGYKIGPLFCEDAEVAKGLLLSLCNHALSHSVSLDVPEPNTAAIALAKQLGMEPVFACVRMYLRGDPGLPLERIYGITTFEAG